MNTSCENISALLTSYLDAELSEEQAAPVRAHLLDCRSCRESFQEGKVVKRWFAASAEPEAAVPQGFAARVARRAFAGDPGLLTPTPRPEEKAPLLPFLLRMTAVAAGLLFCFSLFVRNASLPQGNGLDAETRWFWLDEEAVPEADPLIEPVEDGSAVPAKDASKDDESDEEEDEGSNR